jgi:hypothetical protein
MAEHQGRRLALLVALPGARRGALGGISVTRHLDSHIGAAEPRDPGSRASLHACGSPGAQGRLDQRPAGIGQIRGYGRREFIALVLATVAAEGSHQSGWAIRAELESGRTSWMVLDAQRLRPDDDEAAVTATQVP